MTSTQMPSASPIDVAWEYLLSIKERVTEFAALDHTTLASEDVVGLLHVVEEITRMLPACTQQPLLRQLLDRGVPAEHGCTPVSFLRQALRIRPGEAKARVREVERFQPRTQVTGDILPPRFPTVAAAMAAGEVSAEHAQVIAVSLERLPAAVSVKALENAEEHLVDCAREWDVRAVENRAAQVEAILDPDGMLITEKEREQRREVSFHRTAHGMWRLSGLLDPEAANTVQTALEPLTRPQPGPEGEHDPRSAGRRRADALVQLCRWSLDHPGMPRHAGRPPQLIATVTLHDLEHLAGVGRVNNGDVVSIPRLLRQAGELDGMLAVFGYHGELLHYGRTHRLAPSVLRKALEARDGGCAFPGCDAGTLWTEANHAPKWSHGGRTDIDKMNLYCPPHHRLDTTGQWQTTILDGVPHTAPPPWVDPKQRPRRNRMHDPP